MTIKFYDVAIEATRDATQADFDMLVRYQIEKAADIYDLQQLLDRHGIPLPEGMKRRQPPPQGDHRYEPRIEPHQPREPPERG